MKDKKKCRWIEISRDDTGKNIFTIKLTYLPSGGLSYNPIVKVLIMKPHSAPNNFWERISEIFKYPIIDSFRWDPLFTELSLEDSIRNCIEKNTKKALKISKVYDEYVNLFVKLIDK